MFVIPFGVIFARVRSPAFGPVQRGNHYRFREEEHIAKFEGVHEIGVVAISPVIDRDVASSFLQPADSFKGLFQTLFVAKNRAIIHHDFLKSLSYAGRLLPCPVLLYPPYPVHGRPLRCGRRLYPGEVL